MDKINEILNIDNAHHVGTSNGYDVYKITSYAAAERFVSGTNFDRQAGAFYTISEETFNNNIDEDVHKLYFFCEENTNRVVAAVIQNLGTTAIQISPKNDATINNILSIQIANNSLETYDSNNHEINKEHTKHLPLYLITDSNTLRDGLSYIADSNIVHKNGALLGVIDIFTNNVDINDLDIPDVITSIAEGAFCYNNFNIRNITIGDKVEYIRANTFSSVNLPNIEHINVKFNEKPASWSDNWCAGNEGKVIWGYGNVNQNETPNQNTNQNDEVSDEDEGETFDNYPDRELARRKKEFDEKLADLCKDLKYRVEGDNITIVGISPKAKILYLTSELHGKKVTKIAPYAFYGADIEKIVNAENCVRNTLPKDLNYPEDYIHLSHLDSLGDYSFAYLNDLFNLFEIYVPNDCRLDPKKVTKGTSSFLLRVTKCDYLKDGGEANNSFSFMLHEGKVDDEYVRNYSMIDRDVFDKIALMDPKTQASGDEIRVVGFGAKQLLLANYKKGEKDFLDKENEIKKAFEDYYPNIAKYPKFNEFKSVNDFLTFMKNPEETSIETSDDKKESKLDSIYDKYYSKISKDDFYKIINLDADTDEETIGTVAKNLLLPKFIAGENFFNDFTEEKLKAAVNKFYKLGSTYPDGKDNISNFTSVADFINFRIESNIETAAKSVIQPGVDYEVVASSDIDGYDVFKILTYKGSDTLAHALGAKNVWCTAGGSNGHVYNITDGATLYYRNYNNGDSQLYEILSRKNPTDRTKNYNLAVYRDGTIRELRDGDNSNQNLSFKDLFIKIMTVNTDLWDNITHTNDQLLRKVVGQYFHEIETKIKLNSSEMEIKSQIELDTFGSTVYEDRDISKQNLKKLTLKNVTYILPETFALFKNLEEVVFDDNIKEIQDSAFRGCSSLKKLVLPASLEKIGRQAFAGCTSITGSVRLPDSLVYIGYNAFDDDHCKLKINKNRKTKISFNKADIKWIKSHVSAIDIQ